MRHALMIWFIFLAFGSIRFIDDNDYASGKLILHVNLDNRNGKTDEIKMKFLIMDKITGSQEQFRLGSGDVEARKMVEDLSDLPPGEYMVRIYAEGDKSRRITHRPIIVT